jgi:tetratricopeptide (TPR) repeat protein
MIMVKGCEPNARSVVGEGDVRESFSATGKGLLWMRSLPAFAAPRTMRALMNLFVRAVLLIALVGVASLRAQLASPSPLASERAAAESAPGAWIVAEGRAASALQSGFPALAAAIYRDLLGEASLPVAAKPRVQQALITALLDAGDVAAAEREIAAYDGPKDSPFRLRAGLVAAHARRLPAARAELGEVNAEDLPAVDRPWWHFLQAQIADLEGDVPRATAQYEQAVQTAVSEQQRARFALGQAQTILRGGAPSEQDLAAWRRNMDTFAGQRLGFDSARFYAAGLARLGRPSEALATLERQLLTVPPSERNVADQMRLLIGLIAGETNPTARRAFRELVRNGLRPETQRTALYALARGTRSAAEREQLRRDLTELIAGVQLHPIIEDLLLVRAQASLQDKRFNDAEQDARLLLDRFPGSPLKAAALGVRLAVAWEARLYRTAADVSTQLRAALPPGRERSELGVLLAEAFFRSGDFKNAADAYEAALREAPQVVPTGRLIFQRVLADVRADRLDEAAVLLDEMAGNAAFDVESRWQAEWNLVREMQARGRAAPAMGRVERLLASATQATVPDELRIRLLWLRAKLSYDNGQAAAAVTQADELLAALPGAQVEATLSAEVAGTGQLLKAQALLDLGRDTEGAALLEKLRAEHRHAKVAVYSFIVQAARQAKRGELAAAQKTLVDMVDANPGSEYAPFALYEAAMYAERQGLDSNLRYAYERLEDLVTKYPRDELVFYARLKQGDLLRKLNDFGAARLIYEDLINNRGQHPDVLLAQLALAATLFAQGANNPGNYEAAGAIYERLRDLPTAPTDLRVEAGYMWGYAQLRRGQPQGAQTIFWGVVDAFLLDAARARQLGPTGRYWISRTLLELGRLLEEGGRNDEAQRAYQLVIDHDLGGAAQARTRLERFRTPAEAKP